MKKKIAALLVIMLIVTNITQPFIVSHGADNTPSITYNEAVMTGMGLHNLIDGDYESGNAYVSEDNPDMTDGKQYIQFKWEDFVDYNEVTLYSAYCGTADKDGQAPTKWEIQISSDGENFNKVATAEAEWKPIDGAQSKTTKFIVTESYKYMRIVVLEANLNWGHYAINEIMFGEHEKAEIGYVDANGTRQYARAASITYNDSVMSGNGLHNINDGNYETTYVSEDSPNMKGQYIEYKWEEAINVNLVTLYSQYCGTKNKDGQAPTKWKILTSSDGETFKEIKTVTQTWNANDDIQSKNIMFDKNESIIAMRIEILDANLNWNHYAIGEIEVGLTKEGFVPSDITGKTDDSIKPENPENPGNPGNQKPDNDPDDNNSGNNNPGSEQPANKVYTDKNGTKQYAKASQITYGDKMSGMGLSNLIDGDYTSTYVSEDKPDMKEQYIQFTWNDPIEFNLVSLYAQYCGTTTRDGQAPTKWKILVSTDGSKFTEVSTVKQEWNDNDELQSKSVKIKTQKNVVAVRIAICEANLSWAHYAINEIEIGMAKSAYSPDDKTGYENDKKKESIYVDGNGITQYATASEITYSDKMSGMGLENLIDKNLETTYVSEDNPDMKNQYIQFKWNTPVDINLVTLYTQYCGTYFKDGQAPTKWKVLVSKDGKKFTEVASTTKKWRSNDNVQSKTLQFELQKDIVMVRVVIEEAKLEWGHYAIGEIEIGQAPKGYEHVDMTGVDSEMLVSPKTGMTIYFMVGLMVASAIAGTYSLIAGRKRKYAK